MSCGYQYIRLCVKNQAAVLAQWKSFGFDILGHRDGKGNSSTRLRALCPVPEALIICFNKENSTGISS